MLRCDCRNQARVFPAAHRVRFQFEAVGCADPTARPPGSGGLLERGFWLYVWNIDAPSGRYLYVGRTGDSASPYAASPFNRVGLHLNLKRNAKGNSLARRLAAQGVDPTKCSFELFAIGPIFSEQPNMESHKPIRNQVGALEKALAERLLDRGYNVIGTHQSKSPLNQELFQRVAEIIDRRFPQVETG